MVSRTYSYSNIDHWWQTESGCANDCQYDGSRILTYKTTGLGKTVTGYDIRIFGENGQELGPNEEGFVVIKLPLPPGTLLDLWKDNERFKAGYLNKFQRILLLRRWWFKDDEDYIYITGRGR